MQAMKLTFKYSDIILMTTDGTQIELATLHPPDLMYVAAAICTQVNLAKRAWLTCIRSSCASALLTCRRFCWLPC